MRYLHFQSIEKQKQAIEQRKQQLTQNLPHPPAVQGNCYFSSCLLMKVRTLHFRFNEYIHNKIAVLHIFNSHFQNYSFIKYIASFDSILR